MLSLKQANRPINSTTAEALKTPLHKQQCYLILKKDGMQGFAMVNMEKMMMN